MTIPNHKDVFQLLIAGILNASIDNWRNTNLPFLQQAINQLACLLALQGKDIPNSPNDWLDLFEKPIDKWWPGEICELDLEHSLQMIYDGQPEDWLIEYFDSRNIDLSRLGHTLTSFRSEIDQSEINTLRQWCRDNNQSLVYSAYREFLIRNPWTTITELGNFMVQFNIKVPILIQSFFEEPRSEHYHGGKLWQCPNCGGILRWQFDRPYCVRHTVCSRITSNYNSRLPIDQDPYLRILKYGSHLRTCVPGIPEIKLFDICRELPGVGSVQLWPGYDAYDLRINFTNGHSWAVDVKDVSDPGTLRHTIDKSLGGLLLTRSSDDLGWERAFYVIPDYRVEWNPGYQEIARSDQFNKDVKLITSSQIVKMIKTNFGQSINHDISVGG